MTVVVEETEEALIVRPMFQRLDATSADSFRDELAPQIHARPLLVLALGNVTYMDSIGLGSLLSLLALLPPGVTVRLAEVAAPLQRVLKLTHLEKVLPSFPSIHHAIQ